MKSGKPESRVIAIAFVFMLFSLMIGSASAKTWYVDDDSASGIDFTNIQNAIDAASDGDTVFVHKGTYYENINLKDGIIMQGEGADVTTIDGGGDTVVVEAGNSTIAGFTITGGDWGIFSGYSSPIITNNIISGNIELGILCWSSEIISNNIISNSQSGIYCSGSSPIITNNIITENSIEGIFCEGSSPTITNNIITSNELGISCDISSPAISYNDVWDNGEDKEDNYHGCVAGIGDITADPLFIDPTNSDYHLQAGSPCIDAGTNEGAPSTDFDGNPRPMDGDGDGIAIIDMGAFEYVSGPIAAVPALTPIGLLALIGLLSLIAVSVIKSRVHD
jgi:parallel beta-helix repeat protein